MEEQSAAGPDLGGIVTALRLLACKIPGRYAPEAGSESIGAHRQWSTNQIALASDLVEHTYVITC